MFCDSPQLIAISLSIIFYWVREEILQSIQKKRLPNFIFLQWGFYSIESFQKILEDCINNSLFSEKDGLSKENKKKYIEEIKKIEEHSVNCLKKLEDIKTKINQLNTIDNITIKNIPIYPEIPKLKHNDNWEISYNQGNIL